MAETCRLVGSFTLLYVIYAQNTFLGPETFSILKCTWPQEEGTVALPKALCTASTGGTLSLCEQESSASGHAYAVAGREVLIEARWPVQNLH